MLIRFSKNNYLIIPFIVLFLSSCSTLDGLKFWQNQNEDPDEPRKLQNISNKVNIKSSWETSFDGFNDLGNFLPAFSSDNVFFASNSGSVASLDASSGEQNWITELNFLSSGVAAGFGIIVVSDIDGNVIALNQRDGSILWNVNVKGEVLSKAVIDPKGVIIKTGSGELISLDKDSGEIIWSYRSKLPTLTIRGSSSPVIYDENIYVTFDSGRLGVFEIDSGFPIWDGAISYVSGTSELENLIDADSDPLVEAGLVYTTNYQGKLNIFDIAQQRSIWTFDLSSFYTPIVTRGMLIVVESNSGIRSFSSKNLEESWSNEEYLNRSLSNPVSYKGNIVVGDFEGYLHIINPINGITISRTKLSRKPIKSIYARSNNLFVIDEKFNVFSIDI
tara:strand:+ start:87220 stop:88386 length:1167 start_codon:yes stop_codon:yes gene_type:complete